MDGFFRAILKDIRDGKNIDVYVAIFVNGILALLSFLDILPIQILGGAILASLSWLTLNALIVRKESKQELESLFERFHKSKTTAKDFFTENLSSSHF
jgi:hypothetical protein